MGQDAARGRSAPSSDARGRAGWRGFYDRNPFVALGIAAGVGYILGGGLRTELTQRALKLGVKAFVMPALEARLGDLVKDRQE